MAPITDIREISRIGYGFMASQALFAALDVDVFGRLARGPRTLADLAGQTGLRPGGRLLVHDFMVDDDGTGPAMAALWLLNAITIDPDVAVLTPGWLAGAVRHAGFSDIALEPVVPGITRLLSARR